MHVQLIFILIIFTNLDLAQAKVKCHECKEKDMENGWCRHPTICEDNFCYKANATLSDGHRQLEIGCISTGIGANADEVGCQREHEQNDMQVISSYHCVCNTDFCNEIPKPANSASSKLGSFYFALWPGLMSFFTISILVHFCNQISL